MDYAKEILKDGTAKGYPLSSKQKGLFGIIAGGGTPVKYKGRMKMKAAKPRGSAKDPVDTDGD